jgi:hypothetical protein
VQPLSPEFRSVLVVCFCYWVQPSRKSAGSWKCRGLNAANTQTLSRHQSIHDKIPIRPEKPAAASHSHPGFVQVEKRGTTRRLLTLHSIKLPPRPFRRVGTYGISSLHTSLSPSHTYTHRCIYSYILHLHLPRHITAKYPGLLSFLSLSSDLSPGPADFCSRTGVDVQTRYRQRWIFAIRLLTTNATATKPLHDGHLQEALHIGRGEKRYRHAGGVEKQGL